MNFSNPSTVVGGGGDEPRHFLGRQEGEERRRIRRPQLSHCYVGSAQHRKAVLPVSAGGLLAVVGSLSDRRLVRLHVR